MKRYALIAVLVLISIVLVNAAKRTPPPARCRAQGACKAPAPACTNDVNLFKCDSSGAWVSNRTNLNGVNLVIGGPVVFLGELTLRGNANVTFNQSSTALLTVLGDFNFTRANNSWLIRIGKDDLKKYYQTEKAGSTNFTSSLRQVAVAPIVYPPSNFRVRIEQEPLCHVVYLTDSTPSWDALRPIPEGDGHVPGITFNMYFYTKSACWKWIILVGTIGIYFIVLICLIVLFRTAPALKKWTAIPHFAPSVMGGPPTSHHDDHHGDGSYELEKPRKHGSEDEGDTVRLDI